MIDLLIGESLGAESDVFAFVIVFYSIWLLRKIVRLCSFEIRQLICSLYNFRISYKRNDISTVFLQQILSGKLLLVFIVEAKK